MASMILVGGNDSNNKWRDIFPLALVVLLTRWIFRSEYLVHMDSINFVLGIIDFNPAIHQPHPPGYFLYMLLGKVLNYFTGDPGTALLIISVIASVLAVVIIYMLSYEWFGRTAAIFSGLLYASSPFTWFYGTVALTYIIEFYLVALVGLLCWHISNGRTRLLLPAAVVMGITVGFRQSSILFLAPLCLYSLRHLKVKHWLSAILVFSVTVCAWFFPMLIASGGSDVYFTALNDLWSRVPSARTVPAMVEENGLSSGAMLALVHLSMIVFFFMVTFSAATPIILMRGLSLGSWTAQKHFALVWIVPGILFFTFMFLTFSNMGYMAAIFPPMFAIIGAKAAKWYEQAGEVLPFKVGFVAVLTLANTITFFYAPFYMGYQNTKEYEDDIVLTREILTQAVDPANTLIVTTDSFRHGFREVGYYSPTHLVVQYPEVELSSGTRVFSMHDRKTSLFNKLPIEKYTKFVIFVTPAHEDIQEEFSEMFPEGRLSRVSIKGYTLLHGPASELKHLFPKTGGE